MSGRGELRTFSSSKAKTENEMVLELLQNPDLSVDMLCLKARGMDCAVGNRAYRIPTLYKTGRCALQSRAIDCAVGNRASGIRSA